MIDQRVQCFELEVGGQIVADLWEAERLTPFHDAELAKATREINAILSKIEKKQQRPKAQALIHPVPESSILGLVRI